jgi:hypothetical protein
MNTVLYCSPNGTVYETQAFAKADIDQLVYSRGLECLTSSDRQFDFWFSPSTPGCQRRVNRAATEFLLATTDLTAKTVPLLRGAVVVATHDEDGDLDGLSWQQLSLLAEQVRKVGKRDEQVLNRRATRADGRARRKAQAVPATPARQPQRRTPAATSSR